MTTCRTPSGIVAGIRNTVPLQDLEQIDPASYGQLEIMRTLENHFDLCDIEFTIERGKLWMLQTRVGKRTKITTGVSASPGAAVGKAVFDSARAVAGEDDARRETNPDDLRHRRQGHPDRGGQAAAARAAVVARGMGKTCVCGATAGSTPRAGS